MDSEFNVGRDDCERLRDKGIGGIGDGIGFFPSPEFTRCIERGEGEYG